MFTGLLLQRGRQTYGHLQLSLKNYLLSWKGLKCRTIFFILDVAACRGKYSNMSSLLLAAVREILFNVFLKECGRFNFIFLNYASLASLGTITGQKEKNSTVVPALKLYSLMQYLKSFTKGDKWMALMQIQETATRKRVSTKRFQIAGSELSLNHP